MTFSVIREFMRPHSLHSGSWLLTFGQEPECREIPRVAPFKATLGCASCQRHFPLSVSFAHFRFMRLPALRCSWTRNRNRSWGGAESELDLVKLVELRSTDRRGVVATEWWPRLLPTFLPSTIHFNFSHPITFARAAERLTAWNISAFNCIFIVFRKKKSKHLPTSKSSFE